MDYSFVPNMARIALYDDMLSTPRIVEIPPDETMNFIGSLSSAIYNLSREMGGAIPFSAIRQVTENFIHADFREIVVSVMDAGNTIRFADQGPGIADKERAQLPGFSSANEHMKQYIDGVGSGLPIVREYLDVKHGTLTLDDNLNGGSVVTLSLTNSTTKTSTSTSSADESSLYTSDVSEVSTAPQQIGTKADTIPIELLQRSLSKRGALILSLFAQQDLLGVQDIATMTNIPLSSTHAELRKLEELGLAEKIGTKRAITMLGKEILTTLS